MFYKKQGDDMIRILDDYTKLRAVYAAARGLCFGKDWNQGEETMKYRNALINAVAAVEPLPWGTCLEGLTAVKRENKKCK